MTRKEWAVCLRDLNSELKAAEDSGDEDRRLGTVMALEAFLSVVRLPPPDSPDVEVGG